MAGPLRNFLSGVATSPIGKSFEGLGQTLSSGALATKPVFTGANVPASRTFNQMLRPKGNLPDFGFKPLKMGATAEEQSLAPNAQKSWLDFSSGGGNATSYDIAGQAAYNLEALKTQQTASLANEFGGTMGTPVGGDGNVTNLGGAWAKVDALNPYILEAAAKFGLDPNFIKAVMKLESGGEWITSHAGAIGFMQVVPKYWGHLGYNLHDPRENIMAGAHVLDYYLGQAGGDMHRALQLYHGIGWDGFSTHLQYADRIMGLYGQLGPGAAGTASGTGVLGDSGWSTIFGGKSYSVTQEMGLNSFSSQHLNGMYKYAESYGITGHAGIDVGTPRGTALRSPMSGTVIRAGGSGYYCDTSGCGPGKGELKLKLSNGDEIILGHMASINVRVGQQVTAGQVVGLSGTMNGDHVHVEYRTPDSSTPSGWRVIDPRNVAGGGMSTMTNSLAQSNAWAQPIQSQSYASWTSFSPYSASQQKYGYAGSFDDLY